MSTPSKIPLITYLEDNELYTALVEAGVKASDNFYNFKSYKFVEDAERDFLALDSDSKPTLVLVDLNLIGSSYSGLEYIKNVNYKWGNNVVIGVISKSKDEVKKAQAKKIGAMFWLDKKNDLIKIIPQFLKDLPQFISRELLWKEY